MVEIGREKVFNPEWRKPVCFVFLRTIYWNIRLSNILVRKSLKLSEGEVKKSHMRENRMYAFVKEGAIHPGYIRDTASLHDNINLEG